MASIISPIGVVSGMDRTLEPLALNPEVIEAWFERFDLYCLTQSNITEENKVPYFLTLAGKEAFHLVRTLAHPSKPVDKSYNALRKLLIDHVKPQDFEMTERAKFHSAVRQPGQSIRDYILALQKQAAKCSFDAALETQLRDHLVAGIADGKLQAKLLTEADLTYAKAKQICERHADVLMATAKT